MSDSPAVKPGVAAVARFGERVGDCGGWPGAGWLECSEFGQARMEALKVVLEETPTATLMGACSVPSITVLEEALRGSLRVSPEESLTGGLDAGPEESR